jgi:hypothetical protein
VIQLDRTSTPRGAMGGRAAIDRRADRLVAMIAVIIALLYLCAAILAAFLPAAARVGTWLPLHLALAGGASTAIAGMMPFFSAAFATAQPVSAIVRWASVTAVAAGALGVAVGYAGDAVGLAVAGGSAFMAGLVLTGYATVAPLRRGLGPWGGAVTVGYVCALSMVIVGALIGIAYMTAWPPLLEAWAWVRPAHAWLNLVGFVSLVIATTLLHFFPTVVGARIRRARSAILTVAGLAGGAALVALGFVLRSDPIARTGAVLVLAGSLALAAYAWQAWRTRARWSGDAGWHRFAIGGLVSGIAWFELGMTMACGRLLAAGVDPAESTATILIGPLVLGWVGLTVLASATHLVPAIGPGDPAAHARQRVMLGRSATARLVAANAGIALLAVGLLPDSGDLVGDSQGAFVGAGLVLAGLALGASAALIAAALATGLRSARETGHLRV